MDVIKTRCSKLWDEDGIGIVEFNDLYGVTYEDMKDHVDTCKKLLSRGKRAIIFDIRKIKVITPQATKYLLSEESIATAKAAAVLYDPKNPVILDSINLLLKVGSPSIPLEFFTEKEKAFKWIKQFA